MWVRRKENQQFSIEVAGRELLTTVRWNRRARRIILRYDPAAEAPIVTLPWGASLKEAERFVASRHAWLKEQMDRSPEKLVIRDGAVMPFRGVDYTLQFTGQSPRTVKASNAAREIIVGGPAEHAPRRLLVWMKKQARAALEAASASHAETLDVRYKRISIRDTRSRWGSCSAKGNLNYSWRLICAPEDVLDYVAAHEVAHLKEMNHSKAFWTEVEKCCPDWRKHRKWLREQGDSLHMVG